MAVDCMDSGLQNRRGMLAHELLTVRLISTQVSLEGRRYLHGLPGDRLRSGSSNRRHFVRACDGLVNEWV